MASALDLVPADTRALIEAANNPTPGTFPPRGIREDLRAIASAEAAGWLVKFRNDHWHNGATFERGSLVIWWSQCWRARDYADDFPAVPVRLYTTVAEALAAEGNTNAPR